jgi:DNA-binding XRE family transcriptional regulator
VCGPVPGSSLSAACVLERPVLMPKSNATCGISWREFGRDLRAVRTASDESLAEFAKGIGINKATVSRVENGRSVSANHFMALCAMCKLSPWTYFRS